MNLTSMIQQERHRSLLVYLAVFALCAGLRIPMLDRSGLWADELFSLAIATGHSLEHPASNAQPELGDYVEAPKPLLASEYTRYLRHEDPPVGPARVVRAVLLSDTSPPLYYLLLWMWTQVWGTSDGALRMLSVFWALACFPLVYLLAKEIGGRPATLPALVLFSLSPLSLYYSTEGRMYSLLWFLAAALAWLTLKLNQRGPRPTLVTCWVFMGAAGLLTHYFYAFIVLACGAWLFIYPGRLSRTTLIAAGMGIGLIIAPWYLHIGEGLSMWRVTKDWLLVPSVASRTIAAVTLPWTLLSPISILWRNDPRLDYLAMVVFLFPAFMAIRRLGHRLLSKRRQLMWMCLFAACAGPFVFDKLMGTYTTAVPRYAIAGMPTALVLVALTLGRLRPYARAAALFLILMVLLPSSWTVVRNPVRSWEPFKQLAMRLDEVAASDVVVVHSIPSGVLGIARYTEKPIMLFSWVGQLKQRRVPDDIESLLAGGRIVLVNIHAVGEPAPEEDWLRGYAIVSHRMKMDGAELLQFDRYASKNSAGP